MRVTRARQGRTTIEALGRRALTALTLAVAICAATAFGPTTAGAETLGDQICCGELAIQSQEFATSSDETTAVADDFTVPPGQTWSIGEVVSVWLAKGSDLANLPSVDVLIYTDAGARPGAPLFTGLALPARPRVLDEEKEIFAYEVPLAGVPVLGSGTYWLSLQVQGSQAIYGSWFWMDVLQHGAAAVLRNPGDGFETGCVEWAPRTRCVLEGASEPDQSFRFRGSRTVSPPPPPAPGAALTQPKPRVIVDGKPRAGSDGTVTISIKVSGPGLVSASGKGVKGLRVHVAKAGRVRLKLKLNASGREALRKSRNGRLKVKVKITFTPRGGKAVQATKRVTFRSQAREARLAWLMHPAALISRELHLR